MGKIGKKRGIMDVSSGKTWRSIAAFCREKRWSHPTVVARIEAGHTLGGRRYVFADAAPPATDPTYAQLKRENARLRRLLTERSNG